MKCKACGDKGVIRTHNPHDPDEITDCPDCQCNLEFQAGDRVVDKEGSQYRQGTIEDIFRMESKSDMRRYANIWWDTDKKDAYHPDRFMNGRPLDSLLFVDRIPLTISLRAVEKEIDMEKLLKPDLDRLLRRIRAAAKKDEQDNFWRTMVDNARNDGILEGKRIANVEHARTLLGIVKDSEPTEDCNVHAFSSRACEKGTRGCIAKHAVTGSSLWTTPVSKWTFHERDLVDPTVTAEEIEKAINTPDEEEEYIGPADVAVKLSSGEVCSVLRRAVDNANDETRPGLLIALGEMMGLTNKRRV